MNWKINYWTLLFVAVSLALGYQTYEAKPVCPTNTIPYETGQARASNYVEKWANRQPISLTDSICNKNIRMFLLAKCELQQMLQETGEKDSVYAVLGMNPPNTAIAGQKDTIDLMFRVFSNTNTSKYYDFSKPCPPLCGM